MASLVQMVIEDAAPTIDSVPDGDRVAVITGASSGIGEATARALAAAGFRLVVGARRLERVEALAHEIAGEGFALDVRERSSIDAFVAETKRRHQQIDLLINNAGLAAGLQPLAEGSDDDWVQMMETNVLGVLRVTRAFLPLLRAAPRAHILNLGSVAGFEVYPGGVGYTASKHAVRAITRTLRLELMGEPIRITEVMPGLVETEFSLVRFKGDQARANAVYKGMQPLTAADVAECIVWCVTRPPNVNIDELVVRPVAQATARDVARRG